MLFKLYFGLLFKNDNKYVEFVKKNNSRIVNQSLYFFIISLFIYLGGSTAEKGHNLIVAIFIISGINLCLSFFICKRNDIIYYENIHKQKCRELSKEVVNLIYQLEMAFEKYKYDQQDIIFMIKGYKDELKWCDDIKETNEYNRLINKIKNHMKLAGESYKERMEYEKRRKEHFNKQQQTYNQYQYDRREQRYKNINNASEIVKSLQILGLPTNTTDYDIIKVKYRTLMKKYHTDLHQGLNSSKRDEYEEKCKEINNAHDELKRAFA